MFEDKDRAWFEKTSYEEMVEAYKNAGLLFSTWNEARAAGFEAHHVTPRKVQIKTSGKLFDDTCIRVTSYDHVILHAKGALEKRGFWEDSFTGMCYNYNHIFPDEVFKNFDLIFDMASLRKRCKEKTAQKLRDFYKTEEGRETARKQGLAQSRTKRSAEYQKNVMPKTIEKIQQSKQWYYTTEEGYQIRQSVVQKRKDFLKTEEGQEAQKRWVEKGTQSRREFLNSEEGLEMRKRIGIANTTYFASEEGKADMKARVEKRKKTLNSLEYAEKKKAANLKHSETSKAFNQTEEGKRIRKEVGKKVSETKRKYSEEYHSYKEHGGSLSWNQWYHEKKLSEKIE